MLINFCLGLWKKQTTCNSKVQMEDNIKMDVRGASCEGVDSVEGTVMSFATELVDLRFPQKTDLPWISWRIVTRRWRVVAHRFTLVVGRTLIGRMFFAALIYWQDTKRLLGSRRTSRSDVSTSSSDTSYFPATPWFSGKTFTGSVFLPHSAK